MVATFRLSKANGNGAAAAAAAVLTQSGTAAEEDGDVAPPSTSGSATAASSSPSPTPTPVVIDYVGDAARRASPSTRPLADLVFAFHLAAFLWFARVWLWHLGEQASALPGAAGFGWFFRYLTFCSFTAQTLTLALCCAAHLGLRARVARAVSEDREARRRWRRSNRNSESAEGERSCKGENGVAKRVSSSSALPASPSSSSPSSAVSDPRWLSRAADDAACAIFGLANVVTLMYYAIERSQKGNLVEGGQAQRPKWLGAAVHSLNACVAWADLLLAHPRSFSPRAARASVALALCYCHWLLLVRGVTGRFPYPILNKLPMPSGFFFMTGTGIALFYVLFRVGKRLSSPLLRYKTRWGWPAE